MEHHPLLFDSLSNESSTFIDELQLHWKVTQVSDLDQDTEVLRFLKAIDGQIDI